MTQTTLLTAKFNFFLRFFVGANFLVFVYDLSSLNHTDSYITPFFWLYTAVMMITELRFEPKIGFEELGATFLYGMFASAVIIIALGSLSIILAFLFMQDWHSFYSMFKMLISVSTLIALYFAVKDYYGSIYTTIYSTSNNQAKQKVPVKVQSQAQSKLKERN